MDPDKLATMLARQARLLGARGVVGESATMVNHSLGGIIGLSGVPAKVNQTFGARIATFAGADLDEVLAPDAQADLADAVKLLVYYRNRLEHDQWETLQPPAATPGTEPVIGFGEGNYIDTTLPTIEILASVFESVAAAVEHLDTILTQRVMLDLRIGNTDRELVRTVLREISRVTTRFPPEWRWVDQRQAE